ncbi:MAG: excinuclease subunit, partial [Alphaproteobacteria bacterium]|nr:excinuclease subunit [Alphaproteobacteria bacterium]
QGINPRNLEEADVFALYQQSGFACVEVFFFRTGQNWGNRAYFPKADRTLAAGEVLAAFIAQFYDDKPCPRCVLVSHDFDERELLAEALSTKSGHKVDISVPQRGERKDVVSHALANAKEALGRKLADTSSQQKLLKALADVFALPRVPQRIEVFDNSHIQGTNAVGAMIVTGPEGFRKNQYRKFNIRSDITPGDDYGMMREMLQRRFKRLLKEAPRLPSLPAGEVGQPGSGQPGEGVGETDVIAFSRDVTDPTLAQPSGPIRRLGPPLPLGEREDVQAADDGDSPWPDLLLIDGGQGQLTAARETLVELGLPDIPLVAVAKGVDRDAGNETFFLSGRPAIKLPPRDPVLYFVQRLRDEAHRFAIGSHRQRRKRDLREAGLQVIAGIGPTR